MLMVVSLEHKDKASPYFFTGLFFKFFFLSTIGIPTLMLFKGGQVKERITGYQPKEKLLTTLNPHI